MKKRVLALLLVTTTILGCTACSSSDSKLEYVDSTFASSADISSGSSFSTNSSASVSGYTNSSSSSSDSDYDYSESTSDNNKDTTTETTDNNENTDTTLYESKLVYKCDTTVETLDYDKAYSALQDLMTKYNCIIESEKFNDSNSSYAYYNYSYSGYDVKRTDVITIRVPSANYSSFIDEYGTLGNIISKSQTVDNITQDYYDTTMQVEALESQMELYEQMLNEATTIEDKITLTDSITTLQYQINSYKTQIRTMDMDVAYSYVYLTLKEVVEYSEVEEVTKTNTFVDRLKNTCTDTWKGFLVFLENLLFLIIRLLPTIIIVGIILIIIRLFFWKKIKAARTVRKAKEQAEIARFMNARYGTNVNNIPNVNVQTVSNNVSTDINRVNTEDTTESALLKYDETKK
jgi:hypothetical protein